MARIAHAKFVQSLYEEKYKPMKLAAAHVKQLKVVMLKESKTSKQDVEAICKAVDGWLKEKGLKAKKRSKKKKKAEAKPSAKKGNINLVKATRKQLRTQAKELGLRVTKGMTEDKLRKSVSDALLEMNKGTRKAIGVVDYTKLKECVGVFLDFTNATCSTCHRQKECLEKFREHQAEGFSAFETTPVAELEIKVANGENAKTKTKKKKRSKKKVPFDRTRSLDVFPVDNDQKKGSAEYKLIEKVMNPKYIPENLGELTDLILEFYTPDVDSDEGVAALVNDLATQLVDIELIEFS